MNRFSFAILLSILCFGCSSKSAVLEDLDGIPVIPVGSNVKDEVYLSDFTETSSMLALETSEESIIAFIDKLDYYGERYFILSQQQNSIFIFGEEGQFLLKISKQGEGPEEYRRINDFTIDKERKQVIIYDRRNLSLLRFSFEGEFIEKSLVGLFAKDILSLPDSTILFFEDEDDPSVNGEAGYKLIKRDFNGRILDKFIRVEERFKNDNADHLTNNFFTYEDKLSYMGRLNDTLFNISEVGLTPKYIFDIGEKFRQRKSDIISIDREYLNPRFISGDLLLFPQGFMENEKAVIVFYSKDFQRVTFLFYFKDSGKYFETDLAFNDLMGGRISFAPPLAATKDEFILAVYPQQIYETIRYYKQQGSSDSAKEIVNELEDLVSDILPEDNPIIMKVKFKSPEFN
ncbi:MAG: hypothetical protein ACI9Z3_002111 [Roseivirga sp.]|jgi:hypothetical protein